MNKPTNGFAFEINHAADSGLARVGTITTPHGQIQTPAFIPVGTKATVKTVLPEAMENLGAQALLANAYHLYLQPGPDVLDEAGGLGSFMNWDKPTFTDSGGFQVLSLGVGFKKVLAMDAQTFRSDQVIAKNKERLAHVDDEGVTFKSHLDGSMHRFTAEISMQIQHKLGADVMFAFDECTTLHNTRPYQELAMSRTYDWAIRCLDEHKKLTDARTAKPYQALFGVIQGAQYEDLRKKAAGDLGTMSSSGIEFDGFGIGGALDKDSLGTIVSWVNSTLPQEKPKHLLGIGAPEDLFVGVENGIDTFDCVLASRIARTSAVYTMEGRFNVSNQPFIRDFNPIDDECDCYTCTHYTRAYLCHLFRAKEMVAGTLATIHNERFIVRLVDQMRQALLDGNFQDMKKEFMGRYQHKSGQSRD
ncbi:tRNA guanosine(34) transglycosylase Tgt [Candidatus Planktophila versatilis]|uniref:Queuine tRNA-ribosyltransferase n=1 Tax=Candidatus Planktophila versatilis TaxID=1884905 RepID=A0ABM6MDU5_9ACTN|nr:tRNA guanosine(34) transglycosylase Tgt [Candidatus Planktophila versatilis]ASY16926.1 queuine tRNA-ribosyltransferase [Candidatus Planktophila versatilis]